ncbi:MAG: hypothetical protein ACM3XM_03820 [Mycobacterium leprae]
MTRVIRPTVAELTLDEATVLRYLGFKPGVTQVGEQQKQLLADGIRLASVAAHPEAAVVDTELILQENQVITRSAGLLWQSKSLALLLKNASRVTIVAATLGEGSDTLSRQLFARDEFALATVVDAVSTTLVHALTRYVADVLKEEYPGLTPTPFYGPGYGDWPIADLAGLAQASRGGEIGLTLTTGSLLRPQKSLLGIIGWLCRPMPAADDCRGCIKPDCDYRKRPAQFTAEGGEG